MHASFALFPRRHVRCAALLAASVFGSAVAEARWEQRDSGTLSEITSVQCLSATNAWAAGVGGTVLHSTDGGDTWASVDSGVTSAYGWNSLHFVNSQVGWFTGIKSTGRTVDAGSSWYRIYLPDLSDLGNPAQNAIFATSETEAWTVGVSYGDVGGGQVVDLLTLWDHKKTDSGMVVGEIQLLAQGVFTDVQFLTPDDGFAVGATGKPALDGIIARISNATTDPVFSKQESGGGFYLEGISMVNTMRGFIVGDGGVILTTTNGGDTWLAQPSPTNADLWDVFFLDASHGWAVGVDTVLETTDGGAHWGSLEDAPQARLSGVHFCDADHGFVVGDGGTLLKWVVPRCGDGSIDSGEECDAGNELNGEPGACCTSSCSVATVGTVCRAAAGACDEAEQCDGVGVQCPADELLPAATPCRPAVDGCDLTEVCSGRSAACPADETTPAGHACDDGDPCTVGETCGAHGCGHGEARCVSDIECVVAGCHAATGVCYTKVKPDGSSCGDGSCQDGVCTPPRDGETTGNGEGKGDAGGGSTEQAGATGSGPSDDAGGMSGRGAPSGDDTGDAGAHPSASGGRSAGSGGHAGAPEAGARSSDDDNNNANPESGGCNACILGGRTGSHGQTLLALAGLVSVLAARRRGPRHGKNLQASSQAARYRRCPCGAPLRASRSRACFSRCPAASAPRRSLPLQPPRPASVRANR